MTNSYKRLDLMDRCKIEVWLNHGKRVSEIATLLHRNKSTISREITLHTQPLSGYDASLAHVRAQESKHKQKKRKKMQNTDICDHVLSHLKRGWSPEVISGCLKKEIEQGVKPCSIYVSHETIYQYIYDRTHKKEKLYEYLRYGKRRRTKHHDRRSQREIIVGRVFIDNRPAIVHKRKEVGHWETDTVMYGRKQGINTLVERMTRFVLLTRLYGKTPHETAQAIITRLTQHVVRTITGDNGIENAHHQTISSTLQASFYFCHPYHSWEKGTNENTNGMLRRYLPRNTDLSTVSEEELADIEYDLNSRPRKILGFKSPLEVLSSHYQFVALAN